MQDTESSTQCAVLSPTERLNQLTHGAGFLLSVIGGCVLISSAIKTGGLPRIVGCAAFAISLMLLYAASTLSHSFADPQRRKFYRTVDQICIFILAAGSFTPFALVWADNWIGRTVLCSMWATAVIGSLYRAIWGENSVAIAFFVVIGWLPAFSLHQVYLCSGWAGLSLVLAGGLAYTGGTWFLVRDHKQPYFHPIWHLSTILGSGLHFLFCLLYVAMPVG